MHGSAEGTSITTGSDQIAYTVKHAAKVLDIGERTLWQLVNSGEVESFKIGWSRRVSRSALEDYVKRQREKSANADGAAA